MSDVSDQISTDAQKSQTVSADGVTVTKRSLKDQIEATDIFVKSQQLKPAV